MEFGIKGLGRVLATDSLRFDTCLHTDLLPYPSIYFCAPSAFLTPQLTQDVVHIQLRCDTYLHMIQCLKYAFHKGEVSRGAVFAVDHTEESDLPS